MKQVFDRPSATPSAIVIVGSGVVGTATGEGFLELGHDVTFVDISERRVQELQERGLNASTTVDLPADRSAFIILTLPTPNVGHAYDLSAFTEGTAAVGRALATSAPGAHRRRPFDRAARHERRAGPPRPRAGVGQDRRARASSSRPTRSSCGPPRPWRTSATRG